MVSIKRYKPLGWRGESHRHYLASKGISTRKGKGSRGRITDRKIDKYDGITSRLVKKYYAPQLKISSKRPIGHRISDVGPGGQEFNVKTSKEWDKQDYEKHYGKMFTNPINVQKVGVDENTGETVALIQHKGDWYVDVGQGTFTEPITDYDEAIKTFNKYSAGKEDDNFAKKYYVRNEDKGNREEGLVKSLQAKGYTKMEMRDELGLPIEPAKRKQFPPSSSLNLGGIPEDTSRSEEGFVAEPMPTPPVPEDVDQEVQQPSSPDTKVVSADDFQNEMNSREGIPPPKVATPGVPELPKAGFNIMEQR